MEASKIPLIFLTSLWVGFSGAIAPGPLLTVTIKETLRRGKKAGFFISLGHGILELLLVIMLVAFLLQAFEESGSAKTLMAGIIGLAGGGFLLWTGYVLFRDAWLGQLALEAPEGKVYNLHPFWAGAVITLANPYWTIWWLSAGAGFLLDSIKAGFVGAAAFYLGHILADFMWYMSVSWAVSKGGKIFTDRVYQGIMAFCGAFLMLFGIYFLYSGLKFLS